jgi:hypothetical protein
MEKFPDFVKIFRDSKIVPSQLMPIHIKAIKKKQICVIKLHVFLMESFLNEMCAIDAMIEMMS